MSCRSADGIDVQMVSRGPDQGDFRPDQQIPQARFAHGAVRVPSTALDHGKVGNASTIPDRTMTATRASFQHHWSYLELHCRNSTLQMLQSDKFDDLCKSLFDLCSSCLQNASRLCSFS